MEDQKIFCKLKRHLIAAYTVTAGAILTFVVMVAFFYTVDKEDDQHIQLFQNNFFVISNQLKIQSRVDTLWMADQQEKNNLVIHIEDRGRPLTMPGTANYEKQREELVERVKALAEKEKVDIRVRPISEKETKSSIFRIFYGRDTMYLGQAMAFGTEGGYLGLVLLQKYEGRGKKQAERLGLFLACDFFGILALFLAGYYFISRSLKPVEEARKKQSEFITAASHELRSPLAVMKANLSAMRKVPGRREECMAVIDRECDRMASLVEDLLALSHADTGRRKGTKSRTDAETLLIEVYESYVSLLKERGIPFFLELPEEELPELYVEEMRIRQILCIYIENALRFSEAGQSIVLRAFRKGRHGKYLVFEVEDHGRGIPKEQQKKVFERFYQGDQTRGEKEHFGLGLSLARAFAADNGGTVDCRETAGGGATFILNLEIH